MEQILFLKAYAFLSGEEILYILLKMGLYFRVHSSSPLVTS
jgi:hypothetical protein